MRHLCQGLQAAARNTYDPLRKADHGCCFGQGARVEDYMGRLILL